MEDEQLPNIDPGWWWLLVFLAILVIVAELLS